MKVVFKEWGNYVAYLTFELDLNEINEYFTKEFNFEDFRPIAKEDVEDCMYGEYSDYLDQEITRKTNPDYTYTICEALTDYIYEKKYEEYTWEITDADSLDDEFLKIE